MLKATVGRFIVFNIFTVSHVTILYIFTVNKYIDIAHVLKC